MQMSTVINVVVFVLYLISGSELQLIMDSWKSSCQAINPMYAYMSESGTSADVLFPNKVSSDGATRTV